MGLMNTTFQFTSTPVEYPNTPDAHLELNEEELRVVIEGSTVQVAMTRAAALHILDALKTYVSDSDYKTIKDHYDSL